MLKNSFIHLSAMITLGMYFKMCIVRSGTSEMANLVGLDIINSRCPTRQPFFYCAFLTICAHFGQFIHDPAFNTICACKIFVVDILLHFLSLHVLLKH